MSLPITLNQASALIRRRRTIKPADMDAGRTVDRGLVMRLLEDANWAPTHGMTEPWRFRVFTGDSRRSLAEAMQRIYREVTPPDQLREDKLAKLGKNPLLAPVLIAAWMERRGGAKIPELDELSAAACAIHNLTLSAAAAGLGAFWSSPPLIYTAEFRRWLGIREEDRCLGLIYLGWPRAGLVWPEGSRSPVAEKVSWADA